MDREDRERLVRIETALLDPQTGLVTRFNDHGKRLRSLEAFRNWAAGAGAVGIVVAGMLGIKLKASQ